MGYKVIVYFEDLQDFSYPYQVGDVFPRPGKEVSENRLQELSSNKNKRGIPLIALEATEQTVEVAEEAPKKRGRKPKENN